MPATALSPITRLRVTDAEAAAVGTAAAAAATDAVVAGTGADICTSLAAACEDEDDGRLLRLFLFVRSLFFGRFVFLAVSLRPTLLPLWLPPLLLLLRPFRRFTGRNVPPLPVATWLARGRRLVAEGETKVEVGPADEEEETAV